MNKTDEVYVTLLKAKEKIALYNKEKVKNQNWNNFYNGIVEKVDDIIVDYAITTKMSEEEILNCLFEVGADHKDSIFHENYCNIKMNI